MIDVLLLGQRFRIAFEVAEYTSYWIGNNGEETFELAGKQPSTKVPISGEESDPYSLFYVNSVLPCQGTDSSTQYGHMTSKIVNEVLGEC